MRHRLALAASVALLAAPLLTGCGPGEEGGSGSSGGGPDVPAAEVSQMERLLDDAERAADDADAAEREAAAGG